MSTATTTLNPEEVFKAKFAAAVESVKASVAAIENAGKALVTCSGYELQQRLSIHQNELALAHQVLQELHDHLFPKPAEVPAADPTSSTASEATSAQTEAGSTSKSAASEAAADPTPAGSSTSSQSSATTPENATDVSETATSESSSSTSVSPTEEEHDNQQ